MESSSSNLGAAAAAVASSLENVVAHIQASSGSEEDLRELHTFLKQAEDMLKSQGAQLPLYLSQIDTFQHSLGYIYIL